MISKKAQLFTWTFILLFSFVYLSHDVLIHPAECSVLHSDSHQFSNAENGNSTFITVRAIDYSCPFCSGFLDSHATISTAEHTSGIEPLSINEDSQIAEPIPGISASRAPPIF